MPGLTRQVYLAGRGRGSRASAGDPRPRKPRRRTKKPPAGGAAACCSPGEQQLEDNRSEQQVAALDATDKDVSIGGAGLAAAAIELGLVDELRMFRNPVVIGGGTPFLPPVTEDVPLDLIETRTFGSRVIYERYRRVRDDSD
jgi:hypothetical protein